MYIYNSVTPAWDRTELKTIVFDTSGGLLLNGVGTAQTWGGWLSTAKLFASLAFIPSADNRRCHFPTQFTDALGDAEARPTLSNAISLPVCFKWKLRAQSLSTSLWLLIVCEILFFHSMEIIKKINSCTWVIFMTALYWSVSLLGWKKRQSGCLWGLLKLIS